MRVSTLDDTFGLSTGGFGAINGDVLAGDDATPRQLAWSEADDTGNEPVPFTGSFYRFYDDDARATPSQLLPTIKPPVERPRRYRLPQLLVGLAGLVSMTAIGGVALSLTSTTERHVPPAPTSTTTVAPPPALSSPPPSPSLARRRLRAPRRHRPASKRHRRPAVVRSAATTAAGDDDIPRGADNHDPADHDHHNHDDNDHYDDHPVADYDDDHHNDGADDHRVVDGPVGARPDTDSGSAVAGAEPASEPVCESRRLLTANLANPNRPRRNAAAAAQLCRPRRSHCLDPCSQLCG
ncbi:hypothetical protein I553_0976 [Mycobacterium xenopi 4042]|uniref:Uncharacterized protein n=1 Tax=Mycobacterium xenopi 4042 TaxID=1299334 RepID=X7ZAG9_MYCXE|nr:hypothetical protein I553_0976 [Mycobacterium xenopi 4042]